MIRRQGVIGRQRHVGEKGREQEVAARGGIDEHRVFAKPAEAGGPGEVALGDRCGIDHAAGAAARHAGLQPGSELIDPDSQQVVVVVAPRIPGHAAPALFRAGGGRLRGMVGRQHDHAADPLEQPARGPAPRLMPLEPGRHRAGEPPGQPAPKGVVVRGVDHPGDAHPRKSEPERLLPQLGRDHGGGGGGGKHRLHDAEKMGGVVAIQWRRRN